MLFAAVGRLDEILSLEKILTLNVGKCLIYLGGARKTTVSITEQQLILLSKT
jgi:hypothetical protein